jgi:hypothetical protein
LHRRVDVHLQRQESRHGEQLIGPPKTAAGRRCLALPAELVPELEQHLARWVSPEAAALVFVGEKGGPVRAGVWQKEWDRARRSVGMPELHLHDLRHVAGTLAAAAGAGTKEIMRRLGHATQQAALRYQHATDERDRVLATGLDHLIQAARAEPSAPVVALTSRAASTESGGLPARAAADARPGPGATGEADSEPGPDTRGGRWYRLVVPSDAQSRFVRSREGHAGSATSRSNRST